MWRSEEFVYRPDIHRNEVFKFGPDAHNRLVLSTLFVSDDQLQRYLDLGWRENVQDARTICVQNLTVELNTAQKEGGQ